MQHVRAFASIERGEAGDGTKLAKWVAPGAFERERNEAQTSVFNTFSRPETMLAVLSPSRVSPAATTTSQPASRKASPSGRRCETKNVSTLTTNSTFGRPMSRAPSTVTQMRSGSTWRASIVGL